MDYELEALSFEQRKNLYKDILLKSLYNINFLCKKF